MLQNKCQFSSIIAAAILCQIVLLNKKRSLESSALRVTEFTDRPKWKETHNTDIVDSMSAIENKLLSRKINDYV